MNRVALLLTCAIAVAACEEPTPERQVATFEDWPHQQICDLPVGSAYTRDGDDLMYKLNDEFHVPARISNGEIIGNGEAEAIGDCSRVVGVVFSSGKFTTLWYWRKEAR